MAGAMARRAALALTGLALVFPGCAPARAQNDLAVPFDPARFLAFAASSAEFQRRAASLAATRETRPEVRAFAGEMLRFRERQLPRLAELARAGGQPWPPELEPEHRVVLENLEPLDYLALSRRSMEVQMQALEQEERGYEAAARSGQGEVKRLAEETLPELRRWREEARRAWTAIAP